MKAKSLVSWLILLAPIALYANEQGSDPLTMKVYKTESCGCCVDWITHINDRGFETTVLEPDNINAVKEEHGIGTRYRSCHTGVTADGYVFEGHIPAKFIHQFLASPPAGSIGLSVPGMPVGSPGMEYEDKFMAYEVLLLMDDGTSKVFTKVTDAASQYD